MKKFKLGRRVLAFLLVFIMVISLMPLNVMGATAGDIVTSANKGTTGIVNSSLNQNGTINWPIKVYDYLADGMLFEFAQNQGEKLSSAALTDDGASGGQYVLGRPMPTVGKYSTDYTVEASFNNNAWKVQYQTRGIKYTRQKVNAVDYSSPSYLRLKINTSANSSSNRNYYVSDFRNDNGISMNYATIRYMVMVYRSEGMNTTTKNDYHGVNADPMSFLINPVASQTATESSAPNSWSRYSVSNWTNSTAWTYRVIDLYSIGFKSGYTTGLSITPNFSSASAYLDLAYVSYFSDSTAANTFGKQALEFIKEPGEYITGSFWNGANNTAYGMMYSSNGKSWNTGGGNPNTATLGGQHAAYYTHQIGYRLPSYEFGTTPAATYNNNRKDGRDSAGRFNGTGNLQGENGIYFITDSYISSTGYQAKYPGATSFDMSELDFGGYSLLTQATKGSWTAGLLEGTLGPDGTPVYKQETVEYIADLLSKTLTIPRMGSNGFNNYSFVAGVRNASQYGTTNGKANDLAQGLRNCLGIVFSSTLGARGSAPKMGTYAETLAKASNLKGAFLTVANGGYISTCMDAAYYLLNNLFISNSYNQEQNDFRYLTLSSATLDNGTDAFVFDGGFSTGASLQDLIDGKITQAQYKANAKNAVEYSGYNSGGNGTISLSKVDAKDLYYYASAEYARTTRFPFLPVVDADANTPYAGQTDSYYFAEDGKRNYATEYGTYYGRNYNYVLASNGEFVFNEEDKLFFEFEGDDDVYLFINGQLVLDLGGGHAISNASFNVNDYVNWARAVVKNPSAYSAEEVARAKALDLVDGEIATFDFYYMERHGYGANMRIVTNMHITDPALRVDKTAYQSGKQVEYGGIVDADKAIEYNFALSNIGNTKLYNLTFEDSNIGVTLTPENGLFVKGDDTPTIDDDINGYIVTDAHGERLDASDLTVLVRGYQHVGTGGNYIRSGHTYTKVADGAGTHIYFDGITVNFKSNEELKNFLKTLQSDKTDNSVVDDELTQEGSGLWVDATIQIKGIYYTMTDEQETAGMFDNTVYVTATTKVDPKASGSETLRSEARHRVYVTAIPSYYQWAEHPLFISKKKVLDDSSAEAGNQSSMLHDYIQFFNKVNGDISKFGTTFCDRMGNIMDDADYEYVNIEQAQDGQWGYMTFYPEAGMYEFFLLMYMYGAPGVPSNIKDLKVSDMNLGDYAIVRVLMIVTDVDDVEYVLDYGLKTENLDAHGELFKNDELYGALSGTVAKLMGFTNVQPSYLNPRETADYNRINFNSLSLEENNKIMTEDGYYTANISIPEEGKPISYNEYSGMYTLTESGTSTIHVDCPVSWENLYLYYWYDDGRNNVWPGQKMDMTSHGNFEIAIPSNAPHVIISNGTNQTVDLNLNPGYEAWIDIGGTLNADGKLYATIEYKTADGILNIQVPDGWGDVYVYAWDAFGNGLVQWPGTKVEEVNADGYYTFTIPGDITNVIVNNGDNGKQTDDLTVFAGTETWLTVNSTILGTNEDIGIDYYGATSSRSTETVSMHASVPSNWNGAAIYYWNSNGSSTGVTWPGLAMTKGEDGLYHIDGIPADVTNVIINDGSKDNARQTEDLLITPGMETWFEVNENKDKTIIETTVPSGWGDVYYYFFDNNGTALAGQWPGTKVTATNGVYTMEAPHNATKLVINNGGNGKQSQDLIFTLGDTTTYTIEDTSKDGIYNTCVNKETTLKINVPSNWTNVNVHYWSDSKGSTAWPGQAAAKNADGSYSFIVPAGYNKVIINNGSAQTGDITMLYLGNNNVINVDSNNGYSVFSPSSVGKFTSDFVYGESAQKEGLTFTPTNFMDALYSIWMAITVHETDINASGKPTALGKAINIGKEVQMYKKITVLPASVVYYEDDFAGIKYDTEGTKNVITHYGDGSGSLSQSVNQDQPYGQDQTYQGSENDEMTGGSLTDVLVQENAAFASFEFTGTGFEIIGHTHAIESGTVRVEVYDMNGNQVAVKAVITEFDNGADGGSEMIPCVPIIRFSNLAFGQYKVVIKGVPVYDFANWDKNTSSRPPAKTAYICIDGVRIYQPLDNSSSDIKNLALDKKVEVDSYTGSPYTADLTDGVAEIYFQSGVNDKDWFGFKNTGNDSTGNIVSDGNGRYRAIAVVDLGCEATINNIRLHHFVGTNSAGATAFTTINVYGSTDGKTYSYYGSIDPDTSKSSAYWATYDMSSAPKNARYIKFAIFDELNNLSLFNEIEIYGKEVPQAGRNDAYIETENGASFTEIRNLIADRQAFVIKYDDVDGLTVSGGTSTWIENRNNVLPSDRGTKWSSNNVNSVQDYLLAGPNNEVYMLESTDDNKSALAFYVSETNDKTHSMQLAIRGMDYGAFTGSAETGKINAEIQYGAVVNGELVWKELATLVSTAEQYYVIPYTECPYDAENDRYQVVIRVGDTAVTGMASYTSIKLKGLELNTLNSSEVPDVIYDDELQSTIVDAYGNTLDSSKFVDFLGLSQQMAAYNVLKNTYSGSAPVEGKDTSALGALYDSFTKDTASDFGLTENSRFYIVSENEIKPSAETIETVQLAQSQFKLDKLPADKALEIVWGQEKFAKAGDIIIYTNASLGAEEYKIVVSDRAKIYAKDDNGLLYALNALQKHFRYGGTNAIEGFTAQDKPDTAERTIHLDVARKYLTKNSIVNYIKEMSWMGYNALELHFSEDGGFRADFWDPNYFTSENGNDFSWTVGSRTQYWVNDPYKTDPDAGKYLTAAELVEICETALQYNIEIIPSFDTPAHVDWLTWNHYNNYSAKGLTNTFKYNGTTYTLPTYINYRTTSTYDSRWAVLNLGNDTVQKFAFAMYKDIADFFTQYAGSTKFNIGGDEVALTTSDTWNYAQFYTYINNLNSLLNNEGYTVRMYNDFLDRSTYINQLPSGTTMPTLASNIEIVYWTADGAVQPASNFENQNRKMYNGMNYWTYYVLRIADASSVSTANKGRDARDPNNTWWSFYRNREDYVYGEWNPTLFSSYGASSKYTIWDDSLAGGYFMVWNDYAALNTEVEMWNGVYDKTGVSGTSSNYYSLIERMWSNATKQWNWDIHNSLTFANYETLRDKMGFFPGYVAANSSQTYMNAPTSTKTPLTTVSDTAYRDSYTVTFLNADGTLISEQSVRYGGSAVAPADPTLAADVWYTYTFTGWDTNFSNITGDTVVVATYSSSASVAGRIGYLEVNVNGGTSFTMSVNDGVEKPMGTQYVNAKMEFGQKVTLSAQSTNGNRFIGWMDAKNGELVTTSRTYTFYTSGNDVLVAVFDSDLAGQGLVIFKNDKTNQIIDIQYYSKNDTINIPDALQYPGYEFVSWQYTEAQIKEKLAQGDVTVYPVWRLQDVYFSITVNGGSVTKTFSMSDGKYIGYKGTVVTVGKAPEGKKFAYWADEDGNILSYDTEYKFYPYRDIELTAVFVGDEGTVLKPEITGGNNSSSSGTSSTKETFTIYFYNNWMWSDVSVHYWYTNGGGTSWPGVKMDFVSNDGAYDLYKVELPTGIAGMVINGLKDDGSGNRDQTPDITTFLDGRTYSMAWDNGNIVNIDDSRSEGRMLYAYLYVSEAWKADGAWFAAQVSSDEGDVRWLNLKHISGNIYYVEMTEKYNNLKFARMNPASSELSDANCWELTINLKVNADDTENMWYLYTAASGTSKNMYTMYFVNDKNLENVKVYYTDEFGTYEAEAVFVEKDENGNDVYSMLIPEFATKIAFSDGTNAYIYNVTETLKDRIVFSLVEHDAHAGDVVANVDVDTETLGDAMNVIMSWDVPEDKYTFVNAGLLLVKEEDYNEETFVRGTIDPSVIQFVPAKKYQTASGIHSVVVPNVAAGDAWVVCTFVQYRDADGILRVKYSKITTGKK